MSKETKPSHKSQAIIPQEMTDGDKKKLIVIVEALEKDPMSYEFLKPVDTVGLGLIDYFDYIKHPMDLGTVKSKLKNSQYVMVQEAIDDIFQIWTNCKIYNMEGSDIYKMAETLEKHSRKLIEKHYKIVKPNNFNSK